jgi:NAD(P)-dependent dehydrogenase (short-subunit alcohol dehydrogenase family)
MIYISSSIASLNPPWRGNALYTTSKVALDHMARCWQVEHPDVNVTVLSAGPTGGTEFLKEVPSEIRRRFVNEWQANRRMQYLLDPDDLAAVVIDVLSSRTRIESLVVTPSEDPKA